jgi:mRNA-degrading endonuclease RelE of RelBE toxin-antitoxin system
VYEIRWSDKAWADLEALPAFERRRVARAVDDLIHQAEIETRNRKRLRGRLGALTDAEWSLRIGDLRVLYRIVDERIVQILRVVFKGTAATDDARDG